MIRNFIALLILISLTGCATQQVDYDFSYIKTADNANKTWPRGEVPRYQFVGDLIGEENLKLQLTGKRGLLTKIWHFLIGQQMRAPKALKRPQSVVTDKNNRIYVSDISNQAIFIFDPLGQVSIWKRATTNSNFVNPIGLAITNEGHLLVTDSELGGVFELDSNGQPVSQILHPSLIRPTGLAYDNVNNHIYVADTQAHNIKVFDAKGQLLRVIGQRGEAPGEFNFPTHLALKDQQLLIADTMNARIQRINLTTNDITIVGRRGLKLGNLSRPKGVAFDSESNIYIIESYFDHLLVFDKNSNFLMPLGGTGYGAGEFYLPSGLWIDPRDRLYIADMMNGRVSVFQFLGGL